MWLNKTDNANRAIQGNVMQPGGQICNICKCRQLQPMQVASPDDQILNESKWCHLVAQFYQLVAKIATDASSATW